MALKVTPTQYADKWGRRLNAATTDIQNGVNAVNQAPGQAAAAAADRMLTNLTNAVTSGFWAQRVSSVSLADWKAAMLNKGVGRIAAGVAQAQKSKVPVWTALLNAVDAAKSSVDSMPKGSLADSINRMTAFATLMNQSKGKIRGA